jgi:signal transduction histidine kinase/ligand-binding sensor domain-containing protein
VFHHRSTSAKRSLYARFDRDGVPWLETEDRVLKLLTGADHFTGVMLRRFRNMRWPITTALIVCGVTGLRAADLPSGRHTSSSFHHTQWDGLGAVFDIKQADDGYLWLTTSKGVVRFDGIRFQSVEDATSGMAHSNEIDSVFFSNSGGLWLTTESSGLLLWKAGKLTEFPDRRCTPTRKQGKIIEDNDGSLWVQGASGLFRLRGHTCEAIGARQGYPGGFAAGMLLDSRGTLWVKTRKGPLLFLGRGQARFQINEYGKGVSTSYAFLHEAQDGTIWLSDDQGLRRVSSKPGATAFSGPRRKECAPSCPFGDFAFAPDGSLWAVNDKGVERFEDVAKWPSPAVRPGTGGEAFTRGNGLSSDAAWKVMIDREGVVWIGTNSGLDQLRRNVFSVVALPQSQEHEFAIAAGDRGSLWLGNSGLPLVEIVSTGAIVRFPETVEPIAIRRDHNGTIWASGSGLFHLWRSSGTGFSPFPFPDENLDSVVSLATDRNNDPWILARSGRVFHWSNSAWINQNRALGRKPGVIGAMTDDSAGNVWLGFSDRLVQWDGSAFHTFVRDTQGVSENTMSVRGDHIWLGGARGVQLFRRGHFHNVGWKDKNLPGRVSGLVETDTGDLWVNGFSGVTHVSASELRHWLADPGYAVSAEHLDQQDGLPGLSGEKIPEPSLVEGSNGRLWFATTRGIASLDPRHLPFNNLPPPVRIEQITADGKTYYAASNPTPRLPPLVGDMEIDYTALSLVAPEKDRFRYKLEGVDKDWQDARTRRQAYYTNLAPRKYRFLVKACNNDGVWNEESAALNFSVDPAYYQTHWFQAACLAALLALFWGLYRLRLRQISRQFNMRLNERIGERTRIARELHDTLLQSFQGSLFEFQAVRKLLSNRPEEASRSLDQAIASAGAAIAEGREAIQGLRSGSTIRDNLAELLQNTGQECLDAHLPGEMNTTFHVTVEGSPRPLSPLLQDELYRIGRELLRNAFRHACAKRVEADVRYSPKELRLLIRDDGTGVDPKVLDMGARPGHWGLPGVRERAKLIGAELDLWSEARAGTEIRITVPASRAYLRSRSVRPFRLFGRRTGLHAG